jgi:hypothetical protein
MSMPNVLLLVAAVLSPVANFLLLRKDTVINGIPGEGRWLFLSFVLPAVATAAVLGVKFAGVRLAWAGVAAFAIWPAFLGWCNHWIITALWASV